MLLMCREIGFEELVCLGTFKTNRHVFDWEGHMVEVNPNPPTPCVSLCMSNFLP